MKGLDKAAKALIARRLENEGGRTKVGGASLLEQEGPNAVLDKMRTPFNALKMKRNIAGYGNGKREMTLNDLAREMVLAGYPAHGSNIAKAAEEFIGSGRRFEYYGVFGLKGTIEVRKAVEGNYLVIVD